MTRFNARFDTFYLNQEHTYGMALRHIYHSAGLAESFERRIINTWAQT